MQVRKGFFLTIVSAVMFGSMPMFAQVIYAGGGTPFTLSFHRFFFSIPFLFGLALWSHASFRIDGRQLRRVILLSVGMATTPLLLYCSYQYISGGMATTLHFVYPVLVLLGCALLFRERITRLQALCCLLCVAGIVCFYTPGEQAGALGILLALLSSVSYAFYIIYYARSGLADLNPYLLCMYLAVFSAAESALAAALAGQLTWSLPPEIWALSVLFAFLMVVVASVCFQLGAKWIGPQMASMVSTFEPLTSVVGGLLFLHEALTLRSLTGIVCILLAVVLLAWKGSSQEEQGRKAPAQRS